MKKLITAFAVAIAAMLIMREYSLLRKTPNFTDGYERIISERADIFYTQEDKKYIDLISRCISEFSIMIESDFDIDLGKIQCVV
ncbi:MAG: hypothetical protein LBM16_00760, partial [Clostridiales bacterium]|nr:hypothetical protein [Clostridiales bacterium]